MRQAVPSPPLQSATIESLDQEGRGVARLEGKTVFVEGALAGEQVRIGITRRRPRFDLATTIAIDHASASRVVPRCPHFGICGGCSLQHLDAGAQVAAKQRTLEDAFRHIGRVAPERMLAPIHGPAWGYRNRARLGVRFVSRKGGALVGFHERRSSFIADMTSCAILPPQISELLVPLRRLVDALSIRDRLPQVEVALGDEVAVLVLRHLAPLTPADATLVRAFATEHGVQILLQPGGPETMTPLDSGGADLGYALPDFGVRFAFSPTEFTQVNPAVNRAMVRLAIGLLAPQPGERVADLFCGIGNFTLPIARRGAQVVGIEGSEALIGRARMNARANGLEERAGFLVADLYADAPAALDALGHVDRMLIDPPRDGALAVAESIASALPARIVYVSCNPATLARDASVLVADKGYVLASAGVINMFPHTAHVESIAVFEKKGGREAASIAVDSN